MRVYAKDPGEILSCRNVFGIVILLHTLKCCCKLLKNRVDVSFIADHRSVNTAVYNNSTSDGSAFSTLLPCDLEIMNSSLIFKSDTKTT